MVLVYHVFVTSGFFSMLCLKCKIRNGDEIHILHIALILLYAVGWPGILLGGM